MSGGAPSDGREQRAPISRTRRSRRTPGNDFKPWGASSPWEKKHPAMERTFGATRSGTGATYAWNGNWDVGQGSMEIGQSPPPSRVVIEIDFVRPFEAHDTAEFNLEPNRGATDVR